MTSLGYSRREFLATSLATGTAHLAGAAFEPARDLAVLSLQEASDLVRRKDVSPLELTEACLQRIQQLNAKLNAFITVTEEQALQQAADLKEELARGKWRGPLHGIPIAVKDNIDTAGVRTTAASAVFAKRIPAENAEVVRRLKAAGAVLVGKLNLHEFAHGTTSAISHFGPVHNPWHLDHMAGGSSGGSAAAVAACLCYGALGTDTGASIRLPAACCGIVGLKPTYGLVSARGVIPDSWSFDHVGPMCRTVTDTAMLLSGIAGYDPEDGASVEAPPCDYVKGLQAKTTSFRLGKPQGVFDAQTTLPVLGASVAGFLASPLGQGPRLAVSALIAAGTEKMDPEIVAAVNRALDVLGQLTAGLREVRLPPAPDLFAAVADPEAYAFHTAYLEKTPELYHAETRKELQVGARVKLAEYMQGRRDLDRMRRTIARVFTNVDLLVTPTMLRPPLALAECRAAFPSLLEGVDLGLFNIYGLPALSIPCGITRSGFPIGMQIIGPPLGEAKVLALAHAYEQATDWHKRRPPLA